MSRGAVVFDLDGTLVDSAPDIAAAANRALAGAGAGPLPEAVVRGFIGHGIPALVARMIGHCGLDPALAPGMTAAMLDHYRAAPADRTRPYPGVPAALDRLAAEGWRLGVCTNKAADLALAVLDALALRDRFAVVVGGDSLPQRKPDPAPLAAAFSALGAGPGVFVGDSEVDAETAVRAGVPFALFTGGYRKAAVEDLPHHAAFGDWARFPDAARLLAGFRPAAAR